MVKLVLPRKYNQIFACLSMMIAFTLCSFARAQDAPMGKIPWRGHSTLNITEPAKPQNYAADIPMKRMFELEPKFTEPNINHYADPFAYKATEGTPQLSEVEPSKALKTKISPMPPKLLEYMLVDMNLRDFLQELAKENSQFAVSIARDVDGQIKNARFNGTMEEILQKLAREFNFEWMIDGPELFIAARSKIELKTVKDKRLTEEQFQETIADIYAPNIGYMLKNNRTSSAIEIRGPKDFVKRFEQRFETTEAGQMKIIRAGKVFNE